MDERQIQSNDSDNECRPSNLSFGLAQQDFHTGTSIDINERTTEDVAIGNNSEIDELKKTSEDDFFSASVDILPETRQRGNSISIPNSRPRGNSISVPTNLDLVNENIASTITIGPQHFELLKLIGEGAFGKVIMVRNRLNQELYAMKVITKKLIRKKNNIDYMKSERDILTKINHPFIVNLCFAFQTEQRLFLVMDFLGGGELFYHLKRRGLILERECRVYLAEMVLALEFLHNMGVVHRDLKPENVLLRPNGHICITDFGLAKELGDNSQVRTLCGTSEYMAPEMLMRNGYTKAVDWWSLGALFYEMLAGKPPFTQKKGESQKDLDKKIISTKPSIPNYLHANTVNILKGLLEKDSNKRLGSSKTTMFVIGGVTALKEHPFFNGIDWKAVLNCELEPPINPMSTVYIDGASTPMKTLPNGSGFKTFDGQENPAAHFHEEFTNQTISLSVIEDTLSNSASESNTPALSRSNSNDNLKGLTVDEKQKALKEKEASAYSDFSYTMSSFTCTSEQVDTFQNVLAANIAKAQKNKNKKARKDAARAEQQALLDAAQATEAEQQRVKLEALSIAQELQDKKIKEKQDFDNKCKELCEKCDKLRAKKELFKQYNEKIEASRKLVKAVSRKLRGVTDLQSRIDSGTIIKKDLSSDQIAKLERTSALEIELKEEEEVLRVLETEDSDAVKFTDSDQSDLDQLAANLEKLMTTGVDDNTDKSNVPVPAPITNTIFDPTKEEINAEIERDLFKTQQQMLLRTSFAPSIAKDTTVDSQKRVESASEWSTVEVNKTVSAPAPAPVSTGKYIPVHLRRAHTNPSSVTSVPPHTPVFTNPKPTETLASSSVWGRGGATSGSTPLSTFKGTTPLVPSARSDKTQVSINSTNSSPSSYYSARSSPLSTTMNLTPTARDLHPAGQSYTKPEIPVLQDPPIFNNSNNSNNENKETIPPAAKSWASLMKK
jgi:ribosomal protein S6 kinase beta